MSTTETSPPRESVLIKFAGSPNRGRTSPESTRQAFMLMLALIAAGISGYYTATLSGTGTARMLLALIFAGWLSMIVHTVRSAANARHD